MRINQLLSGIVKIILILHDLIIRIFKFSFRVRIDLLIKYVDFFLIQLYLNSLFDKTAGSYSCNSVLSFESGDHNIFRKSGQFLDTHSLIGYRKILVSQHICGKLQYGRNSHILGPCSSYCIYLRIDLDHYGIKVCSGRELQFHDSVILKAHGIDILNTGYGSERLLQGLGYSLLHRFGRFTGISGYYQNIGK